MAWYIVLCVIVLTLAYVFFNYFRIRKMSEGTDEMIEMAGIIRSGASTFMKTEYKTIAIVVVVIALVFSLFVEATSGYLSVWRLHEQRCVRTWHGAAQHMQMSAQRTGPAERFRLAKQSRWRFAAAASAVLAYRRLVCSALFWC